MAGLYRPRKGRIFGGVCAALARRFDVSPLAVRALVVISCVLPGPQILLSLGLWIMIPSE